MPAWCLPPKLAGDFLAALKDGRLSPERLLDMSSEERRTEFAKFVGADFAHEVNAQFESKLLLKDQQAGLVNWAKKIGGITEPARRDIINQINKLDRVLQPEDEKGFLADLAAKKLGVTVTADEAKQIFDLAQAAELARQKIVEAGAGNYRAGYTEEAGIAYGRATAALTDKINSLKPNSPTFGHVLENVAGLTRQLETGIMHFSAPGVQAYGLVATKPFWTGIGKMFQFFANDESYKDYTAFMVSHPDFETLKGGGLGLTKVGEKLSSREEDIQSSLLEGANQHLSDRTGIPNLIKKWSQSFTGYLNYVRFENGLDLLNAARQRGEDITPTSEATHDICQVINNFSGRAELGYRDSMGQHAVVANMLLYTVRKNVATFQMLNPWEFLKPKMSPTARAAAIKQLVGAVVFTGGVVTLSRMLGAQVSTDPRDSDFLKINVGGDKFDLGGSNTSYVRFMARLFTNSEVVHGQVKKFGADPMGPTLAGATLNFLRGKLAPNASIIVDAIVGKDQGLRPFSVPQELYDRFTPIFIHGMVDHFMNNPEDWVALAPALSSILGIGWESRDPPMSESGRDVFGGQLPPFGSSPAWRNDPVIKEAESVGLYLNFPSQKIRGVALTPDQYEQYVHQAGVLSHMGLEATIATPNWSSASPAIRKATMQSVIRKARDIAANGIMGQAMGGPNDIMAQSYAARQAAAAAQQPAAEAAEAATANTQ